MMYSQVPPPDQLCSEAASSSPSPNIAQKDAIDYSKPEHVASHQWKKFQELKARREKECSKTTEKRKAAIKNKALRAVSCELSSSDKALLEEEGVSLSQHHHRKRKSKHIDSGVVDGEQSSSRKSSGTAVLANTTSEKHWEEVKQYLDPNPQLKEVDKGRYATKSHLEEKLDLAIEEGQFEAAVGMSERLSQREFASKVATAFDCHDYVKRKKIEEEKRKGRKQKLKWRFEHKQRWEMKGNM